MIRSATVYDVPRIQEIINSHAELANALQKVARSTKPARLAIYEGMADSGLRRPAIIWADLAEVRSWPSTATPGPRHRQATVDGHSPSRRLHIRS